jgi:hypothetical protein
MLRYRIWAKEYRVNAWLKFNQRVQAWESVGIKGMQERLSQLGGGMNIESNGSGTSVIVNIPVPKEVRAPDTEPISSRSADPYATDPAWKSPIQ